MRQPAARSFSTRRLFRGIERFLLEMATAPEVAEYIMDRVTDFYYGYFERLFAEVGDLIDIFRLADDIGAQNNLLISPKMLRPLCGASGQQSARRWPIATTSRCSFTPTATFGRQFRG